MPTPIRRRRTLTAARVRRARRVIARDRCPTTGIRHRWQFDGFFWHRCPTCAAVS